MKQQTAKREYVVHIKFEPRLCNGCQAGRHRSHIDYRNETRKVLKWSGECAMIHIGRCQHDGCECMCRELTITKAGQ